MGRHRMERDSGNPDCQKTVEFKEQIVTLFHNSNGYNVWTAANPEADGTLSTATFPETPDINSLSATDNALFCLGNNGSLRPPATAFHGHDR